MTAALGLKEVDLEFPFHTFRTGGLSWDDLGGRPLMREHNQEDAGWPAHRVPGIAAHVAYFG